MLLGKRPRPPMKRTTSMTEITFDLSTNDEMMSSQPSDPHNPFKVDVRQQDQRLLAAHNHNNNNSNHMMMASPRNHRRNSADFVETSHFLRSCSLCRRRLVPNRDIYMYRGDSAFCSLECRQQQMNQDERMEKCSLASKKLEVVSSSASAARSSQVTAKGETVAAL
ncbi:hypothetical protein L484_021540 [Morus notabilis]|uniref:FLZ-type domain-containing protein n=1 Tax=Morus notabilis TaxID=981085 RepID=W9SH55_9ROSA|nr:uncharacterized protein LOC21404393 [Morus notabilis]EXC06702.1 hypothetical protein L484_021540 [Morus notabilis]